MLAALHVRANRWRNLRWEAQRRNPPRCPRGWQPGPPDFVGVGAQKAGTSWWYQLLARHPQVTTRGHPKELHHLVRVDPFGPAEAARYAQWFPRPPGKRTGEWSTGYLADPRVPERLARAAPEARILVLLRDPLERYRSGVTMERGRFADVEADALRRTRYGEQLARLYDHFPRDRVLVLQYERCAADPTGELARTYRFLGLDDTFRPRLLRRGVNVTPGPKVDVSETDRARIAAALAEDLALLTSLVPDLDRSLWPSLG